jgi:putative DNA primase/helicase
LPTGNSPKKPQGKVSHHKILNFDGVHVATHVRTDYWDENGEKAKDFHWVSPDGTIGLQGIKTADLPLYGAELLRGLSAGTAVVITEGEKAAGALRKMGMVAVGTVSGAKLIPSVESLSPLVDFDLLAWPDNDEVGHQHMDRICDRLWTDFNNKSVRIVDWKDAPYKGDAFDAIQQEVDIEALLADAKTSHPQPQSQDAGPTGPTKEIHPLTQLGNSERLVDTLGHVLSYSPELGWLMYDGTRWRHVEDEEVEHLAKAVVRSIHHEAGNEDDSERRIAISKWARTSEAKANITAMVSLAKGAVFARLNCFDQHSNLFNVANGTLDLNTQTLRPHDPQDLLTVVSPVEFVPEATCPTWDKFLKRIFRSHPEIPAYLQAVIGYSLTASTKEQMIVFLYGLGANGKTTFIETVLALFGISEYGYKVSAETFLSSGRANAGPQPEIAALKGKRVVVATESEAGRFLNETFIKESTGGDTMTARNLYHDPFSFRPEFQAFLATNNRPVIREQTKGLWRRIRLVPFIETITDEERIADLGEYLRTEEMSGVLNWALEGYRMYCEDGLITPQAVIDETEAYQSDEDPLGDFLAATCVLDAETTIPLSALNHVYKGWCETNGQRAKDVRWLGRMLTQKGYQRTERTRESRGDIIGIRVKKVGEKAGG